MNSPGSRRRRSIFVGVAIFIAVILALIVRRDPDAAAASEITRSASIGGPSREQRITRAPVDPSIPVPGYLTPVDYPPTGTRLTRVTDRQAFGTDERVYKHDYARRSAWNADGSLLLLIHPYPARLLDGVTYRLLGEHQTPADPLWSHSDPDQIFGIEQNLSLVRYSISSRRTTVVRTFPGYESLSIGGGEGVQSRDDRFVVLLGSRPGAVDLILYDFLEDEARIRTFAGFTGPGGDIDWAGVSPSGDHVVVKIDRGPSNRGFDVYDRRTFTLKRRLFEGSEAHADMGFDDQGREVLVTTGTRNSAIFSARLDNGSTRLELPARVVTYNIHVSCRNFRRPGWCFISTYSESSGFDAFLYRGIFGLKLDGSGTVVRYAPALFAQDPPDLAYERQPWAVPDPTGSRVLFSSDWGDGSPTAVVHTFVAEIP